MVNEPIPARGYGRKVAVFASGRGSNFRRIHAYLGERGWPGDTICCLVSDQPDCQAVHWAREQGIDVHVARYSRDVPRKVTETAIVDHLVPLAPDLVVLAGFMRLLCGPLLDAWPGHIINIHPSLLPRHPGTHGIRDSFESKDASLGITIHHVDHGMDTGRIILQNSFRRDPAEDLEATEERIHRMEHQWYPLVVEALLSPGSEGSIQ